MVQLTWDAPGTRRFETGIDRGVLYPGDDDGVAWNGLIAMTESPSGGEATPYYTDGEKYANVPTAEDFAGTIDAYTYPDELEPYIGYAALHPGLFVTQQFRQSFGVCYRTKLGDDIDGTEKGYKLHLVYNVLLSPSERAYQSLSETPTALPFSWPFTTTPMPVQPGIKPMAHLVINSTKVSPLMLRIMEEKLYGSPTEPPTFLTPQQIIDLYNTIQPGHFLIEPDVSTGLAELIEGAGSDLALGSEPGLYIAPPETRLVETVEDGLYTLEE